MSEIEELKKRVSDLEVALVQLRSLVVNPPTIYYPPPQPEPAPLPNWPPKRYPWKLEDGATWSGVVYSQAPDPNLQIWNGAEVGGEG